MAHTLQGAEQMLTFFPGLSRDQLPDGLGWAVETITLTTHSGTHLDAPYHYHPTMDRGRPSHTIDEIPLEWCYGNGVLLDFRHKEDLWKFPPISFEHQSGSCSFYPF